MNELPLFSFLPADGVGEDVVCLLSTLRGMSSLSLLVVACPVLEILLFCFFAAVGTSVVLLSRFSLAGFGFFKGLLGGVDIALLAAGAAADVTDDTVVVFGGSVLFNFRFLGRGAVSTGRGAVSTVEETTFVADFSV